MTKNFLFSLLIPIALVAFASVASVVSAQGSNESNNCDYSGVYSTNWGEMTITHTGNAISADYTHDEGKLSGTLDGTTLTGNWSESPTYAGPTDAGPIEFYFGDDCASFTGVWAYESTESGWDGDWAGGGTKVREIPPPQIVEPEIEDLVPLEEPFPEPVAATEVTDAPVPVLINETVDEPTDTVVSDIENALPRDPIQDKYGLPTVDATPEEGEFYTTAIVVPTGGEVFIFRTGHGWRGPLTGSIKLWPGEYVHTLGDGSAEILFGGASRMRIAERTTLRIPVGQAPDERGVLVRGAINVFENIKKNVERIIRNEPFELEGGHSISSRKGTDFIMEVNEETGAATFTVNEGAVDVWLKSDPAIIREIGAGESAQVNETSIEDNAYEWDALIAQYDWTDRDNSPVEDEAAAPTEEGDDTNNKSNGFWVVLLIFLFLLGGGGSYFYKKR